MNKETHRNSTFIEFYRLCGTEIIFSITELVESLKISVIAEYVENEEQKEILHSIGCDIYQGYLYSKAVPVDEDDKD